MSKLEDLAKKYSDLREEKRRLATRTKEINEEMGQIEPELVALLEDMGAQNVKLDGVGTVYLVVKTYVSVPAEHNDAFLAWLDERGLGALAKRQVNPKTLQAQYAEWEETDQPLPPADVVTAFRKTEVGLRK